MDRWREKHGEGEMDRERERERDWTLCVDPSAPQKVITVITVPQDSGLGL